ncbi:reticulon-4 receptor-like 2 isoform X1 [Leptopilina heterotoma]|uniref:reticulon-4 receptor-like 2 isoform X1 n=2 Tax=Leptopilina heterotoma TaxID=63436 RepID=UPI001CA7E17A|nr:reticulon-4 receptor-like 2 isoform X1 [Leptopilina heterotoma]
MLSKMRCIIIIIGILSSTLAQDANECDRNWHNLETDESSRLNCGPMFENRCQCERICYEREHKFVVNCTNAGFTSTAALSYLPNRTQVLLFTGNNINTLPPNIFGTLDSFPDLEIIDMSNNHIKIIKGQSYHHVKNVRRLILDFNDISLDPVRSHPRIFSNFISLEELHLTDAFEDSPNPKDLASTLHDIFVNSNLTKLRKLHLEQNEISEFRDPNVFCDLSNLWDLHLGDNQLTALHFNLSCLHNLRFLDLQRNRFAKVLERDLHTLDTFAKHNQSVTVDFALNPFECNCKLNPFIKWFNKTKISVRNKEDYTCKKDDRVKIHLTKDCAPILRGVARHSGTTVLVCLLSLLVISLVGGFIYMQRAELKKKFEPVLDSMNKRVRYTTIATGETREVDV